MEKFYFETFFQLKNWGLNAYDSPITLCLKSFYYSYYMSTLPDSPGERHLFSKLLSGAEGEICLTCPGQQQWDNSSCLRWPLFLSLPLFLSQIITLTDIPAILANNLITALTPLQSQPTFILIKTPGSAQPQPASDI